MFSPAVMDISELDHLIKSHRMLLTTISDSGGGGGSAVQEGFNNFSCDLYHNSVDSGLDRFYAAVEDHSDSGINVDDRMKYFPAYSIANMKKPNISDISASFESIDSEARFVVSNIDFFLPELLHRLNQPGLDLPVKYHRPLLELLTHAMRMRAMEGDNVEEWSRAISELFSTDFPRLCSKLESVVGDLDSRIDFLEALFDNISTIRRSHQSSCSEDNTFKHTGPPLNRRQRGNVSHI